MKRKELIKQRRLEAHLQNWNNVTLLTSDAADAVKVALVIAEEVSTVEH